MADKKISALTAATTPLAGTEVLPIVQSGTTVKVSAADITAGRTIDVAGLTASFAPASSADAAPVYIARSTGAASGVGDYYQAGSTNNAGYFGRRYLTAVGWCAAVTGSNAVVINTGNLGSEVERVRVDGSGNISAVTGNLVVGTAGKGIDFSANGGDVLSQYDEGTWTPTDASGAGLTFSGTSNNCFYTRVGNLVTCTFALVYPTTADVSGAKLGGLPFTSKATANSVAGGFITYTNSALTIAPLVGTNDTGVNLFLNTGGSVGNNQLSTFALRGIITYMV